MQNSWMWWPIIGLLLILFYGYVIYKKRAYQGRMKLSNGDWVTYRGYLDDQQVELWREVLMAQVKKLLQAGWPKAAIANVYLKGLIAPYDEDQQVAYLEERLNQTQVFGSPLFCQMWHKASRSQLGRDGARELLRLSLKLVTMDERLSGDLLETQTLLGRFSETLSPADAFWHDFASVVQVAFPGQGMANSDQLARQIHQFRYVISAQQAQWVREHYRKDGATDRDALVAYLRAIRSGKAPAAKNFVYSVTDSARLHNKVALTPQLDVLYPDGIVQVNFKVLFNFHTEFILDGQGRFLNEIDLEGPTEAGIVNGASFNYANRQARRHFELDILPVKTHDPQFRTQSLNQGGRKFSAPNKRRRQGADRRDYDWMVSYFNAQGRFAQDGQSVETLVKIAGQNFKQDVEA